MSHERWIHRLQKRISPLEQPERAVMLPLEITTAITSQHERYKRFLVNPESRNQTYEERWAAHKEIATKGRQTGEIVDSLTPPERVLYVSSYMQETGFPNTALTAQKILTHTTDAITHTSEKLGVSVAFAGYADTCSVGRKNALPGSDLDVLTIILREEEANLDGFVRHLTYATNPKLTDPASSVSVLTMKQMHEFVRHLADNRNRVNAETLDNDTWKEGKILFASEAFLQIRTCSQLINNLDYSETKQLSSVRNQSHEDHNLAAVWFRKDKHTARRELVRRFSDLSPEEQFIIVRVMQVFTEAIGLDVTKTSPHNDVIQSLLDKGLLTMDGKNVKAKWACYPWVFRNLHVFFYPNEAQFTHEKAKQ